MTLADVPFTSEGTGADISTRAASDCCFFLKSRFSAFVSQVIESSPSFTSVCKYLRKFFVAVTLSYDFCALLGVKTTSIP